MGAPGRGPPSRARPGELAPGAESSGRFDSPEDDPLVEGRPQRRVCTFVIPEYITDARTV